MTGALSEAEVAFLRHNHAAVMATIDEHGFPHVVPVGCALVDGRLWSSGRHSRVRTRHLRERPHATLTVLPLRTVEQPGHRPQRPPGYHGDWVTVFGTVEIRTDDPVGDNLLLYREIMGRPPDDPTGYAAMMLRERRLVYVLTPVRTYGPTWRRARTTELEVTT
jgi:PPOX class probable F420-dependent enzyme